MVTGISEPPSTTDGQVARSHGIDLARDEIRGRVGDVGGPVTRHETVVVVHMEQAEHVAHFVTEGPPGRALSDDRTGPSGRKRGAAVERRHRRPYEVDDYLVRSDVVAVGEELILFGRGRAQRASTDIQVVEEWKVQVLCAHDLHAESCGSVHLLHGRYHGREADGRIRKNLDVHPNALHAQIGPPVPESVVGPDGEYVQAARPPGLDAYGREHRTAQRLPSSPGGAVPPPAPHRVVGSDGEEVQAVRCTGDSTHVGEHRATERFPPAPARSVPPPVPYRIVRPDGENIQTVGTPGNRSRRRDQDATEPFPTAPGGAVPPLVPERVVLPEGEDVQAVGTPGNRTHRREQRPTEPFPSAPYSHLPPPYEVRFPHAFLCSSRK